MFGRMIEKAVHKSQHCQRNWDLSQKIPEEDLQVLETAITACPSKQNYIFYKPLMITNRELIDKLYHTTQGFDVAPIQDETGRWHPQPAQTNSQTLAQLLVVFLADLDNFDLETERNPEVWEYVTKGNITPAMERQQMIALGIASGYLNLTASLLGYSTGCCTCFNRPAAQKVLNTNKEPLLMMGVGIPDRSRPRREHHKDKSFTFPTFTKDLKAEKIA